MPLYDTSALLHQKYPLKGFCRSEAIGHRDAHYRLEFSQEHSHKVKQEQEHYIFNVNIHFILQSFSLWTVHTMYL